MREDPPTTIVVVLPRTVLDDVTALTGLFGEDRDTLLTRIIRDHLDVLGLDRCPACAEMPHAEPVCTIRECLGQGCCRPRLQGPRERIGNRIRRARGSRAGLTAARMAALLGISQAKYSKTENGRRHIRMHEITAIADILMVGPETLIGDDIHYVLPDEKKDQ